MASLQALPRQPALAAARAWPWDRIHRFHCVPLLPGCSTPLKRRSLRMDCKTALALLERYLDNELDRADARELETHVDSCADCAAALARLGDLRQALRDAALGHPAPAELRERIRGAAAAAGSSGSTTLRSRRINRRAMPQWSRLAAACVLAFGAGGVSVHLWDSAQTADAAQVQLTRELFASHWRALAAASPVD